MNNIFRYTCALLFLTHYLTLFSQYSRQDSLRGSITPERSWWDLKHYHLEVDVDPADSTITGRNTITYEVLQPGNKMQVDLQTPLRITRVSQNGEMLTYNSEGNAHFIQLTTLQTVGSTQQIVVNYAGRPHVAKRAPWDGGITWTSDSNGLPFVASSCQGIGASIWWPCKDHMYDEPDSMKISVTTPENLMDVSNGKLVGVDINESEQKRTFHWVVRNPINNYGVNLSIGDYVHFEEDYEGLNGNLELDYYVLRENLEKAKIQFSQVPKMMQAFEHWFGAYPFYEDGFKLIEVPYLGMEHQSAVTYGNGYQNGYLGRDLSGTGWGLKFDFIIIHEAGHEWFANNITYRDIADMWIHESFTAYSESLYLEYFYGEKAGADYVIGTRRNIQNDKAIIGTYNTNTRGSGDMYYKGSNMLHTLRQIIDDDESWRAMLTGLNAEFYHKTVTTQQIEEYISNHFDLDLKSFFDQYLRGRSIPILEYAYSDGFLQYRWSNVVDGFDYPVKVYFDGNPQTLHPVTSWRSLPVVSQPSSIKIDRNFYIGSMNLLGF